MVRVNLLLPLCGCPLLCPAARAAGAAHRLLIGVIFVLLYETMRRYSLPSPPGRPTRSPQPPPPAQRDRVGSVELRVDDDAALRPVAVDALRQGAGDLQTVAAGAEAVHRDRLPGPPIGTPLARVLEFQRQP